MSQPYYRPPGPWQRPATRSPLMYTDQRYSAAAIVVAWLLAVGTFAYMLPWAIAASRGKSNHGAIAIINLLLGWTLIGWVAALVMACGAHQASAAGYVLAVQGPQQYGTIAPPAAAPPPGWYPAPEGLGQRYWDGHAWTEHWGP